VEFGILVSAPALVGILDMVADHGQGGIDDCWVKLRTGAVSEPGLGVFAGELCLARPPGLGHGVPALPAENAIRENGNMGHAVA
jgi:hypothetical protein